MFVKIDGITTAEGALAAAAAGADAIGFVFAPSPRRVDPDRVREITRQLPEDLLTLGVFVDESPATVVETVRAAGLRAAQLHGRESVADTRWVRAQVGTVFKAFAAGDPEVARAADYGADAVILDQPGGGGGSGEVYDWSLAAEVPGEVRLVLAGGLTPENVGRAVAAVGPWGVDVSSGVESSPGRKDPDRLRAFVIAARSVRPDPSGSEA